MGRNPKEPNAECVDCGKGFRRPPSTPLRRCKKCRKGMQGIKAGTKKKVSDVRKADK